MRRKVRSTNKARESRGKRIARESNLSLACLFAVFSAYFRAHKPVFSGLCTRVHVHKRARARARTLLDSPRFNVTPRRAADSSSSFSSLFCYLPPFFSSCRSVSPTTLHRSSTIHLSLVPSRDRCARISTSRFTEHGRDSSLLRRRLLNGKTRPARRGAARRE